jgi:predicted PhzF superfamily epimerase YddE/YHI9
MGEEQTSDYCGLRGNGGHTAFKHCDTLLKDIHSGIMDTIMMLAIKNRGREIHHTENRGTRLVARRKGPLHAAHTTVSANSVHSRFAWAYQGIVEDVACGRVDWRSSRVRRRVRNLNTLENQTWQRVQACIFAHLTSMQLEGVELRCPGCSLFPFAPQA